MFLKKKRGIIKIGTGGGKTVLFMGIYAAMPGLTWLVIVPNTSLVKNTIDEFKLSHPGVPYEVIAGSIPAKLNTSFTVVTYHTLVKRLRSHKAIREWVKTKVTGVAYDEVHTSASASGYACTMNTDAAYVRLGLSATPTGRSDGKNLFVIGGFGRELIQVESVELVEAGDLAKPTIFLVPVIQTGPPSLDWAEDYLTYVVRSKIRLAATVWIFKRIVEKVELPCLVLFWAKEHGKILLAICERLGYRCRLVYGPTKQSMRDQAQELIQSGEVDFVIGSDVFAVGINAPNLRSLVRCGGKKAEINLIQGLGRVLRVTDDIKTVSVYDVWDRVPPATAQDGKRGNEYNARHSAKRKALFRKEGHDIVELPPFN